VHAKDVLRCIITAPGEPCVIMDSLTQQQASFATCSDTDTLEKLLEDAMVPAVDGFGCGLFDAMERKPALANVDTTAGQSHSMLPL